MKKEFYKYRKWILKNINGHVLDIIIQYFLVFIYMYIIFIKMHDNTRYHYIVFLIIFVLAVISNSRGVLIDLLLNNRKKVEGEIIEKVDIYARFNRNVIGNKRTIRTRKGKMITVTLYNNIDEKSEKLQKIESNEKYKTIYHYLFFSKVVVFVEYAKDSASY